MRVNYFIGAVLLTFIGINAEAAPSTALPLPDVAGNENTPSVNLVVPGRLDVEKLEIIQGETMLLEAQALRAKAEIAASGGVVDDGGSSTATAVASGAASLPRISEIAGGSNLSAHLIMPDNSEVQVFTGQTIATTDMTVSKITAQGVVVTRSDGTTVSLPMNDE